MVDPTKAPLTAMLEAWGRMAMGYGELIKPLWEQALVGPTADGAQQLLAALGKSPDPARVQELWRGALAEYRVDVETLAETASKLDASALATAWTRLLAGDDESVARKALQRMLEVAAVKATHGPEYWADPQQTPTAPTPRNLVHRDGPLDLYRYDAGAKASPRRGAPVLLVYSLINRPSILDLTEGYSFVRHLLDQGLDVYVFEWRDEDRQQSEVDLSAFLLEHLAGCVAAVRRVAGAERVSLFGHCMGGPFAALHAARQPDTVDRLVVLTAPFTSNEGGVVAMWTDKELFAVDAIVERYGYMPGKLIRHTFIAFKPYLEAMKAKLFLENIGNDQVMGLFMAVDRWVNDNPDVPGTVFRELMVEIYREDRLRRGETELGGEAVDLAAITCPVLSLAAQDDWIVSPASAEVLNQLVSSEHKAFEIMPGGHVSIMVDPRQIAWWSRISNFLLEAT